MEKSSFFKSINGDRKYKAEDFAKYFATFIANGVFPNPSNNLQVMANNDMTVTIKAGPAWINGYIYINTEDLILTLDVADGVLNRIDRIVLRMDTVGRAINAKVKKGAFASSPAAPSLQRDADGYEIALADIYVTKGAISITQSSITDLRLNKDLCGIVHGTVDQVDTTTLFNQYQTWFAEKQAQYNNDLDSFTTTKKQAFTSWYSTTTTNSEADIKSMEDEFENEFNTWFASIKNVLSGDTAGNLLNLINGHKDDKNNPHQVTVSQIGAVSTESFNSHKADNTKHLPSGGTVGQVVQKQSSGWGLVDLPPSKDIDNGRYQADFGLDNAVLNNINVFSNMASLGLTIGATTGLIYLNNTLPSATNRIGIKIHTLKALSGLRVVLSRILVGVTKLYLLNSAKTVLTTIDVTGTTPITLDIVYNLATNTDYYIAVDANGSNYTEAWYGNISMPTTTDVNITAGYDGINDVANFIYAFETVTALFPATTGTVTKTVTPTDLKKWGNVKWTQTIPTNTSVTCDVLKSDGTTVLKSNVASIADLSDIDIVANPSLKIRWTLSRNSVSDSSPTVSNASVTWEGKDIETKSAWEKIVDVTLTNDVTQVDFQNLGLENYKYIRILLNVDVIYSYPIIQFNSASGNVYSYILSKVYGTNGTANISQTYQYSVEGIHLEHDGNNDEKYSFYDILVNNSQATKSKNIFARYGCKITNSTMLLCNLFGVFNDTTNLINKISLSARNINDAKLKADGKISIMGVK